MFVKFVCIVSCRHICACMFMIIHSYPFCIYVHVHTYNVYVDTYACTYPGIPNTNYLVMFSDNRINLYYSKLSLQLASLAQSCCLPQVPNKIKVSTYHPVLRMSLFCFFSHPFFFPAILLFSTYFSEYFA